MWHSWKEQFKTWWASDFLVYELRLITVMAVTLAVSDRLHLIPDIGTWVTADIRRNLYGVLGGIMGGLLGFVITGLSILLTMGGGARLRRLRESKHFKTVCDVFNSAARWLGGGALLAVAGLVIDRTDHSAITAFYPVIWATGMATARIMRCIWVLENVVEVNITDLSSQSSSSQQVPFNSH